MNLGSVKMLFHGLYVTLQAIDYAMEEWTQFTDKLEFHKTRQESSIRAIVNITFKCQIVTITKLVIWINLWAYQIHVSDYYPGCLNRKLESGN